MDQHDYTSICLREFQILFFNAYLNPVETGIQYLRTYAPLNFLE